MRVPAYDALKLGGRFVVTGWFYANNINMYPKLISRSSTWHDGGWGIECGWGSDKVRAVVGGDNSKYLKMVDEAAALESDWVFVTAIYDGPRVFYYENGAYVAEGEIVPATDNSLPLSFGNQSSGLASSFNGQYDEIRLRGGTLSAARIKADYDMIVNRNFCTYGKMEGGAGK